MGFNSAFKGLSITLREVAYIVWIRIIMGLLLGKVGNATPSLGQTCFPAAVKYVN